MDGYILHCLFALIIDRIRKDFVFLELNMHACLLLLSLLPSGGVINN